jgi:peptidyl-prolyl cis-trans isomerase C
MFKQTILASLSLALAGLSFLAPAAEPTPAPAAAAAPAADKPVAIVNGVAIPQLHAGFLRRERAARGQPTEALSDEAVREALIASELLAQQALKKPVDPSVQSLLEFQRRDILGRAALEDFARQHPIPEETLKAEYEKAKAKAGTTEYRARHILVDSEKTANELVAQLKGNKKKAKFEDLAKKHSKDSSAGNGGDLGWVLPANLVPEFSQVMVGLKKGQMTDKPVQTQFGWHIIRLDETRALDFPDYERLKPRIQQQLQQVQVRQWVRELMATAKVE